MQQPDGAVDNGSNTNITDNTNHTNHTDNMLMLLVLGFLRNPPDVNADLTVYVKWGE